MKFEFNRTTSESKYLECQGFQDNIIVEISWFTE